MLLDPKLNPKVPRFPPTEAVIACCLDRSRPHRRHYPQKQQVLTHTLGMMSRYCDEAYRLVIGPEHDREVADSTGSARKQHQPVSRAARRRLCQSVQVCGPIRLLLLSGEAAAFPESLVPAMACYTTNSDLDAAHTVLTAVRTTPRWPLCRCAGRIFVRSAER